MIVNCWIETPFTGAFSSNSFEPRFSMSFTHGCARSVGSSWS